MDEHENWMAAATAGIRSMLSLNCEDQERGSLEFRTNWVYGSTLIRETVFKVRDAGMDGLPLCELIANCAKLGIDSNDVWIVLEYMQTAQVLAICHWDNSVILEFDDVRLPEYLNLIKDKLNTFNTTKPHQE